MPPTGGMAPLTGNVLLFILARSSLNRVLCLGIPGCSIAPEFVRLPVSPSIRGMRKMESEPGNAAKWWATSTAECKAGEREQRAGQQTARTGPELLEGRAHGEPDSRRVRRGEERPRCRDRRRRRDAHPPARKGSQACGCGGVRPVLGNAAKG